MKRIPEKLMEKCTQLKNDVIGEGERESELVSGLGLLIERYRFDSCKERLRVLFDQLLVAFMKEKSGGKCIRPIPVLCGDGRPVDLFKLFWVVRRIGGYDAVSIKNLWAFVLEECGLFHGFIPSVKLIYRRYLDELDRWLGQGYVVTDSDIRKSEIIEKLDLCYRDLENKFRVMNNFAEHDAKKVGSDFNGRQHELHPSPDAKGNGANDIYVNASKKLGINNEKQQLAIKFSEIIKCKSQGDDEKRGVGNEFDVLVMKLSRKELNEENGFCKIGNSDKSNDKDSNNKNIVSATKAIEKVVVSLDDERFIIKEDDYASKSAKQIIGKVMHEANDTLEKSSNHEQRLMSAQKRNHTVIRSLNSARNVVVESRKRKRNSQSWTGMLNWLKHVAKNSDDPSIGKVPECSNWNIYGNNVTWRQALLVRDSLLIRRNMNTKAVDQPLKDRNKKHKMHPSMYEDDVLEHHSAKKHRCSVRVSSAKAHLCSCCNSHAEPASKDTICEDNKPSNLPDEQRLCVNLPPETTISIGPQFQAEIPVWTGIVYASDPKWLGARIWPQEGDDKSSNLARNSIGTERQSSCDCPFRNSVECVRFHIAEKRLKLKRELGSIFHHWGFHRMGEEVSLSWTEEEEKRVKDMIVLYGAFSSEFWDNVSQFLPTKTRQNIVTYYFDVYLVRRRSYQNRVTPRDVNSDDDEKACGLVGENFGYKALNNCDSRRSVSCTLNAQVLEFDI